MPTGCREDSAGTLKLDCAAISKGRVPQTALCEGVQRILDAPCSALRSVAFVQDTIESIGLMGGTEPNRKNLIGFYGRRLLNRTYASKREGMWQDPRQYAHALVAIDSMLESETESSERRSVARYIEVGVYTAWTACLTSAFVRRVTSTSGSFEGFAVDVSRAEITSSTIELLSALNVSFRKPSDMVRIVHDNWRTHATSTGEPGDRHGSKQVPKASPFDVCFVDGLHTYAGVRADYVQYAPLCRSLMLHDIADQRVMIHDLSGGGGVAGFWSNLVLQSSRLHPSTRGHRFGTVAWPKRFRQLIMREGSAAQAFGIGLIGPSELSGRVEDGPVLEKTHPRLFRPD